MTGRLAALLRRARRLEEGLLVAAVLAMVALAVGQIGLRNVAGMGLVWIEPLLRALVLWIGMLGALLASRGGRHISLDVVTRVLPRRWRLPVRGSACALTAVICALLAWQAARYTMLEYDFAATAFAGVPAWAVVVILPVTFGLIGVRYALFAIAFFRGDEPFAEVRS